MQRLNTQGLRSSSWGSPLDEHEKERLRRVRAKKTEETQRRRLKRKQDEEDGNAKRISD